MTATGPVCDECGSSFHPPSSRMESLCAECSHWLYGYPNCPHEMIGGSCTHCGWNGSTSAYVAGLKPQE